MEQSQEISEGNHDNPVSEPASAPAPALVHDEANQDIDIAIPSNIIHIPIHTPTPTPAPLSTITSEIMDTEDIRNIIGTGSITANTNTIVNTDKETKITDEDLSFNIKEELGTYTSALSSSTAIHTPTSTLSISSTITSTPTATTPQPYTISQHMLAMEMESNKRRSSSRSIKRRRFDDEIVEYSLGIPGTSVPKLERKDRKPLTLTIATPSVSGTGPSPVMPAVAYPEVVAPVVPQVAVSPAAHLTTPDILKRRSSNKPTVATSSNKRSKKKSHLSQMSTKDLGRWKPTDDLALIIGIQQTNDLRMVHRGIKFSCRFTVSEIQSRWYALLYNAEISRVAVAAMRNLHPDIIACVRSKALFSNGEEELLSTLTSNSQPTIEKFRELLEQNPSVFYPTRTPKSLMAHWQLLKQYSLLPDQTVQPLPKGDGALSFSEAEELINDSELQDPKDEVLETELNVTDRWNKKEIRLLENSVGRWQVLVESVTGTGTPEFDKQTLAVLRGRLVRYLMRSREITVGRTTKDHSVDVDLNLEGPANKISRRQATIRLRNSGDFFLASEGKRAIYVDGRPILRGNKVKLNHNSVIEISSLKFIFLINQEIINIVRHETVRNNSTTLLHNS